MTQFNLGNVYTAFFEKTGEEAWLDSAEEHVRAALEVFREAGAGQYVGMAEGRLALIARLRSGG